MDLEGLARKRAALLEWDEELGIFTWNGRSEIAGLDESQEVLFRLSEARESAERWRLLAETAMSIASLDVALKQT